jgi:CheY-specific phosphatase CheX
MLFYNRGVQKEILEIFIEAVRQVFRETDLEISSVDPGIPQETDDQIITSVCLTGDVKGIFMLLTDTESAARVLRAMSGTVRLPAAGARLNEIQLAALGELANQISGRAITILSERRLTCDITPPAILAAEKLQSCVPDVPDPARQTIRGPFGRLTLFLGLQA